MRTLSIAGLQAAPIPGDPDATIERFAAQAAAARKAVGHLQLLVAPELYLSAPQDCSRRTVATRPRSRSRSPGR